MKLFKNFKWIGSDAKIRKSTKTPIGKSNRGWNIGEAEVTTTLDKLISKRTIEMNGLIRRNAGRGLIKHLLNFVRAILPRTSKSVVKQVASFIFDLHRRVRHNGMKGAVLYLKACQVLLQQSVGGYYVTDLADLKVRPKRNRAGLPRIIPSGVRVLITRDRHIPSIRLWMTLFGLFRIMGFFSQIKLSTILDPGVDLSKFVPKWDKFVELKFLPMLNARVRVTKLGKPILFPILKAGPTSPKKKTSSAVISLIGSARLWLRMDGLFDILKTYTLQLGVPALANRIELVAMADEHKLLDRKAPKVSIKGEHLGKLGFKNEAAGKIRVFAMVDAWTQWALAPIHKYIFSILKQLVMNDGTFDQLAPLKRLQVKFNGKLAIGHTFSSMDLSAATDRLPLVIQKSLLKFLLRDKVMDSGLFAEAWGDLLVKRPYAIPPQKPVQGMTVHRTLPETVMYKVGQPMGALSSWAMLAITHHAIVQFAASRAGFENWFEDYAVLGDDVVIMDPNVANSYRQLLQRIGVSVGMAKSIVAKSRFVCEFAKKFFVDDQQADMLPIKECIATTISTSLVAEFVRKYNLTLNQILAFLGYGYKSRAKAVSSNLFGLGTRLRVLLVWLSHPSSPFGTPKLVQPELGLLPLSEDYDDLWSYYQHEWMRRSGLDNRWFELNTQYQRPYPYLSWLLQKQWLTPFEEVPFELLFGIRDKLYSLLNKRYESFGRMLIRWENSIPKYIDKLDRENPVMVSGMNLWGSTERYAVKDKLSWNNILSSNLAYSTQVDMDVKNQSIWDVDRADTHRATIKSESLFLRSAAMFGIYLHFGAKGGGSFIPLQHERRPLFMNSQKEIPETWSMDDRSFNYDVFEVEQLLELLFTPHPITKEIPQEWWREEREKEKNFDGFMETYKLWQELSKGVWARYNMLQAKSNLSSPIARRKTRKVALCDQKAILRTEMPFAINGWLLTVGQRVRFIWWWFVWQNVISDLRLFFHILSKGVIVTGIKRAFTNVYYLLLLHVGRVKFKAREFLRTFLYSFYALFLRDIPKLVLQKLVDYKNRVLLWNEMFRCKFEHLMDLLILAIMLVATGICYDTLDETPDTEELTEFMPSSEDKGSTSDVWKYIVAGTVVLGLLWLGSDLYSSYQTTLNYLDPAIKPLYLPPYAGITEVIPSGIGRAEIISMFEPRILGTNGSDLLSPVSPHFMYRFWE